LEDLGIDGRILLQGIIEKRDEKLTAFMWFRAGTSGRLL
jgi:hypothetical protein